MGIEVLSPSINESNWEFTIEDVEDGNSNVRFGMGAVKNVGKGPVEALIEARKEGIFEDLTDLANRVDLRKVGKRALESLIKAGALDQFGPRMALLQVMEKAISISSSQFQAAEEGQLSFFGADSGIVQKIEIPKVDPDYNKREQLNWERELVGLFISDHPLRPVMEDLKNIVSHFSSQLAHTEDQQLVKVAGMVSRIRPHITKKGDQMAFVALEDTHGIMNLVIFPRTWKEVQELMEYDKVVIVDGKIDAQGGEPKILVDRVSTNAEYPKPFEEKSTHRNKQVQEEPQAKIIKEQKPKTYTNSLKSESFEKPSENETVDPADDNIDLSKMPPQPDVFPMGWEEEFGTNSAISPKNSQPDNSSELDTSESKKIEEDLNKNKGENQNLSSDVVMQEKVRVGELKIEEGIKESQKLSLSEPGEIPSVASAETDSKFNPSPPVPMVLPPKQPDAPVPAVDGKPRMATVVLRNFADLSRDNLRMRRVHGMLISYPGIDRFAFYVIERERGYRIEFPNDTTHISSDMIARIEAIVGKENVIIEEITFQ
jgi:DNA polymerase-3 subunit alpha